MIDVPFFLQAAFINDNDYAGAFIWSVEMDDFGGYCGEGKYPLLSTITKTLRPQDDLSQQVTYARPQSRQASTFKSTNHMRYFLPRDNSPDHLEYLNTPPANQFTTTSQDFRQQSALTPNTINKGPQEEILQEDNKYYDNIEDENYDYEYDFHDHPVEQYTNEIPIIEKRIHNAQQLSRYNRNYSVNIGKPTAQQPPESRRYTDRPIVNPYVTEPTPAYPCMSYF